VADEPQEQVELAAWRAHAVRTRRSGAVRVRPSAVRRSGPLRAFSGALAAGLSVLAMALVAVQIWTWTQHEPGPRIPMIVGHLVAAALALGLQRFAMRRRDLPGGLAALGAIIVVLAVMWIWWWSA
jgi:hypothetical protein